MSYEAAQNPLPPVGRESVHDILPDILCILYFPKARLGQGLVQEGRKEEVHTETMSVLQSLTDDTVDEGSHSAGSTLGKKHTVWVVDL